jgi:hypothetical protein
MAPISVWGPLQCQIHSSAHDPAVIGSYRASVFSGRKVDLGRRSICSEARHQAPAERDRHGRLRVDEKPEERKLAYGAKREALRGPLQSARARAPALAKTLRRGSALTASRSWSTITRSASRLRS